MTSFLARRKDWQRELRVPRYADFAAQATNMYRLRRELIAGLTKEGIQHLDEADHEYTKAFDQVQIVGPVAVSEAAHNVNQAVADWFEDEQWTSASFVESYPMFRLAMRDFIDAASTAIGTGKKHEHIGFGARKTKYDSWKASAEKRLSEDPQPPPTTIW